MIKPKLILRAKIIAAIRRFFTDNDFLEVETPLRIPAPAPEAHIDAQPTGDFYLHTSPELCMKRLLAGGYQRIYQICHCFRQKERGRRHLPEFTLLEWYFTHGNYLDMMVHTEDLIKYVACIMECSQTLLYQTDTIDLASPWERLSVKEAFDRFGSLSMEKALKTQRFDEIMGMEIEPQLGFEQPVFLYDYPAQAGALAKIKSEDTNLAERFELYIAGVELCNAFSELTDTNEQRRRFERELAHRSKNGRNVYPLPHKFLDALEFMPPACGNALGIDRLVMLFGDTDRIDEVVAFTPEEL
ncbi:MAG: EF-P lysine aminoacylase EpmA [Desulfobacteraceae bacterium]